MRNDLKPEKQHYVPQFLLNNFCIPKTQNKKDKQIYAFDKHNDKEFLLNIKGIASERDFNEFSIDGKNVSLESHLTKLETVCAPIIKKIIDEENLNCLTDEEKEWIAVFVSSQFHRVRRTRETLEELIDGIKQHMSNMGIDEKEISETCAYDTDIIKALSLGALSDQRYPSLILNKVWILFKSPKDYPFFISDNPVIMHNDSEFFPYGNIGFGAPMIQIYLPISSNLTIGFWCPNLLKTFYQNLEEFLKIREALINKLNVSPHEDKVEINNQIEICNKELAKPKDFLNSIEMKMPILQTSENTKFLNSHQVRWAHRFVMCSSNDFSLVKRMISDNPNFRESIKVKFN